LLDLQVWQKKPVNSEVFVVVKKSGGISELAKFNSAKDSVLYIGTLGDKYAGLTFSNNGALYRITGDVASNPNILYTVNTSTAV
jgi:hypothetical protein